MIPYDTVICDVDGVLIDVSQSYTQAAIDAVKTITGSDDISSKEVLELKGTRGFNDDWHVAVAATAWSQYVPEMPFDQFVAAIDSAGGGLKGLEAQAFLTLTSQFVDDVTRVAQEAYGGLDACQSLYGFAPQTIRQSGRYRDEFPLPGSIEIRDQVTRLGIISGRSHNEMALAAEMLGWSLPTNLMGLGDSDRLNKPNPKNFLRICDRLGSRRIIYAGDSRDDYDLVQNAKKEFRGKIDFALIRTVEQDWNVNGFRFDNVAMMLSAIEVINDE